MHVIAYNDDAISGYVGWACWETTVGEQNLGVAGIGGVLVSDSVRGLRLGPRLINEAANSMKDAAGIDFGYLGCREEVAPFYQSCGWTRVAAAERSLDRAGAPRTDSLGQAFLILPIDASTEWPSGEVDLKGRTWWLPDASF